MVKKEAKDCSEESLLTLVDNNVPFTFCGVLDD